MFLRILIVFISSLSLVGCFSGNRAEIEQAQLELAELEAELEQLKDEEDEMKKEKKEKSALLRSSTKAEKAVKNQTELMTDAGPYLELLETNVSAINREMATWDSAVRKSLQGRTFKGLQMEDGTIIESCVVKKIQNSGVVIEVDGTSQEILWEAISPKSRTSFLHPETLYENALR